MMLTIKHSILPSRSSRVTQRSRRHTRFKLVAIMGVFKKEMKMSIDMHVDYNRSVMYNVMMQIL